MRWLIGVVLVLSLVAGVPARSARAQSGVLATLCAPYDTAWVVAAGSGDAGREGQVANGMPAVCPGQAAAAETASMSLASLMAGGHIVGRWQPVGLTCDAAMVISMSGGVLTVNSSGRTTTLTLEPSPEFGVIQAHGEDGDYSLIPETDYDPKFPNDDTKATHRLTIQGVHGTVAQLTKCP